MADKTLKEMITEFEIAKDLIHPNIVKYLAFMRKYDPVSKEQECHIIMEQMDGGDLKKSIDMKS